MKVHTTLTNYARGLAPDLTDRTASFLAPEVVTGVTSGQYKDFGDRQAFETYNTARAIGGAARRIVFEETDKFFNAKPNALETGIDDHERAEAGAEANLALLQQSKIKVMLSNAALSHTVKVINAANAAVAAEVGVGADWDSTADPVREIDALIEEMSNEIGVMPNRILFSIGAWAEFRNSPAVIERQPGASLIALTTGLASTMFLNPNMEVEIATRSFETSRRYAVSDKQNVVGNDVWVFYNQENPTVFDPSFMKTFRPSMGGVLGNVVTYRDDRSRSDIYATDWAEDIKVTSAVCARRITVERSSAS